MKPLVSVIVPVYNVEPWLHQCIDSILAQTHQHIELILVNDGSTDRSLEICCSYQKTDSRVFVIDKDNTGVSDTRNAGINSARGDFIGFVDSDDHIDSDMYENLLRIATAVDADLVALHEFTIKAVDKSDCHNRVLSQQEALRRLLLLQFPTSLWAYLYKRSLFDGLRLNTNIHFFEDFEFVFRLLSSKATRIALMAGKPYHYRSNPDGANQQRIGTNHLTCLRISDMIEPTVKAHHTVLTGCLGYFRAHCLISLILRISKNMDYGRQYIKPIRKHAVGRMTQVIFGSCVPLAYKAVLIAFILAPSAACALIEQAIFLRNKHSIGGIVG